MKVNLNSIVKVAIGSFYADMALLGLFALPIFLSAILGLEFKFGTAAETKVLYPNLEENSAGRLETIGSDRIAA